LSRIPLIFLEVYQRFIFQFGAFPSNLHKPVGGRQTHILSFQTKNTSELDSSVINIGDPKH